MINREKLQAFENMQNKRWILRYRCVGEIFGVRNEVNDEYLSKNDNGWPILYSKYILEKE